MSSPHGQQRVPGADAQGRIGPIAQLVAMCPFAT